MWAATAASYFPSWPGELHKLIATEYWNQGDGSPCIYFPCFSRSRLVKAEILAHEQSCITVELLAMFVVAYEEQSRTEEIIRMCLPQIKSKHLLLASFGNFEEENEQFRVS